MGIIYDFEGWLVNEDPSNFKPYRDLNDTFPDLLHIACPTTGPSIVKPSIGPNDGYDYIAPMLYYGDNSYQDGGGVDLDMIKSVLKVLEDDLGWDKSKIILTAQVKSIMVLNDTSKKVIDWLKANRKDYAGLLGWLIPGDLEGETLKTAREQNKKFFDLVY